MKLYQSLSFKIIIVLVLCLLAILSATTYYNVKTQEEHWIDAVIACAERTSIFAESALRHGMRRNQREDLEQTIHDLSETSGIESIRIYDKTGVIQYSTDETEIGEVVDMDEEACTMCHGTSSVFKPTRHDQFARVYDSREGFRILGFINPIRNEKDCYTTCHAHTDAETVLGVLDVQMSLESVDSFAAESRDMLLLSSLLTLLAAIVASGIFVYVMVHKPIARTIRGTKEIAEGNFDYRLISDTKDEIGELASSFNNMSTDLKDAKNKLVQWSHTLEEKVDKKTRELQEVQAQILHMEKMASLGKLSSMIAHELNNPLAGILNYAKLIRKRIGKPDLNEATLEKTLRDVDLITSEVSRCGDIVKNLLFFARSDSGTYMRTDMRELLDKSVKLVQHKADMQRVSIEADFDKINCHCVCDGNQIQQAVVAIMVNGIEAMPDGGTLNLRLTCDAYTTEIVIKDHGPGIEEKTLTRIFEPFYTTKEEEQGTGLGLSVVYGIVQRHRGDLRVFTDLGKGTVFRILLPTSGPENLDLEEERHDSAV